MTIGVGGQSAEFALASLQNMTAGVEPITTAEYQARCARAQQRMRELGIDVMYLHAGTSMRYFTGTVWSPSERMVAALLPAHGEIEYIVPHFEIGSFRDFQGLSGTLFSWQEHESPYAVCAQRLSAYARGCQRTSLRVAISECTPFFVFDGLRNEGSHHEWLNARSVTAHARMRKSTAEIALMQRAKNMTMAVHKAVASMLHEGISTTDVEAFIHEAHKKVGAAAGSYFCIVLFGEATQYPHGVKEPQRLRRNDIVLIDTGCKLHGYISDITRTYVFGEANARQREIWAIEKAAQAAAFDAAQLGRPCRDVDVAARAVLAQNGLAADYALPGLPHRTGHGIGLDIHEWPYLVGNDETALDVGMTFSNEPMICVPGEFGIRLEDHFYMTEQGPRWFTQPSHSIDDPFGLHA